MDNILLQIWRWVMSPQLVLLIGFWKLAQINTLHLILQLWLLQNHISMMIICMLVMVRDFLYFISVILKYIHHIVLSPCLTFFMFRILQNVCFLFRNFVSITIFILNFTRLCFISRILTLMKNSSQVRVKMVSMLYPGFPSRQLFKHIGLPASRFYKFITSSTRSSYLVFFNC